MHKKKALYTYEFRNMWGALIVGAVMAVLGCVCVLFYCDRSQSMRAISEVFQDAVYPSALNEIPIRIGNDFSSGLHEILRMGCVFIIPVFALLTFLLFRVGHKRAQEEYFASLPFTETEKFRARLFTGYGIITVVAILFSVGVLLIRERYIEYIYYDMLTTSLYRELLSTETIWMTLSNLLVFWLVMIACYTIFVAMHTILNSGMWATIVGVMFIFGPSALTESLIDTFYREEFFETQQKIYRYASILVNGDNNYCNLYYVPLDNPYVEEVTVGYAEYMNSFVVAGILLGAIALAMFVAFYHRRKRDMAKQNCLVAGKKTRIVLSVLVGIGVGKLLGSLLEYFFMVEYLDNAAYVSLGIWAVCSVIGFFVCNRLFRKKVSGGMI